MLDASGDNEEESLSLLTKRLVAQTRSLAEVELLRLRVETEARLDRARRAAVALALLIPLGTLLIGTLGAGLVLFMGRFVGYMASCFIIAGLYLVLAIPVVVYLKRTLMLVADPTPDPPSGSAKIDPATALPSQTTGGLS